MDNDVFCLSPSEVNIDQRSPQWRSFPSTGVFEGRRKEDTRSVHQYSEHASPHTRTHAHTHTISIATVWDQKICFWLGWGCSFVWQWRRNRHQNQIQWMHSLCILVFFCLLLRSEVMEIIPTYISTLRLMNILITLLALILKYSDWISHGMATAFNFNRRWLIPVQETLRCTCHKVLRVIYWHTHLCCVLLSPTHQRAVNLTWCQCFTLTSRYSSYVAIERTISGEGRCKYDLALSTATYWLIFLFQLKLNVFSLRKITWCEWRHNGNTVNTGLHSISGQSLTLAGSRCQQSQIKAGL